MTVELSAKLESLIAFKDFVVMVSRVCVYPACPAMQFGFTDEEIRIFHDAAIQAEPDLREQKRQLCTDLRLAGFELWKYRNWIEMPEWSVEDEERERKIEVVRIEVEAEVLVESSDSESKVAHTEFSDSYSFVEAARILKRLGLDKFKVSEQTIRRWKDAEDRPIVRSAPGHESGVQINMTMYERLQREGKLFGQPRTAQS